MPRITATETEMSQLVHCEIPTSHLVKLDRLSKKSGMSKTKIVKEILSTINREDLNQTMWKSSLSPNKKSTNANLSFRITPKIGKQISRLANHDDRSVRSWMRRSIMFSIETGYAETIAELGGGVTG